MKFPNTWVIVYAIVIVTVIFGILGCQDAPNQVESAAIDNTDIAEVALAKGGPAVQRPISEFVDAQTSFFGWFDRPDEKYFEFVDYTGYFNNLYNLGLGTTVNGKITERPLADGTAEVSVEFHTKNALVYVRELNAPFQMLLGGTPFQVSVGQEPAIGSTNMKWVFINSAPGDPIPNLGSFGGETIMLSINTTATGYLHEAAGLGPDGSTGKSVMNQVGLQGRGSGKGATEDGYPVEFIKLNKIGN